MKPNFLFVGLGKTGSSLMHRVIKRHPRIFLSSRRKELDFFKLDANYARGEAFYDEMFDGYDGEEWVGDISPSYYGKALHTDRILEFYDGKPPKIILSVRHPLSQFYSRYMQVLKIGNYLGNDYIPQSFSEEFARGVYFRNPRERIKDLVERLGGPENILLLVYEDDFAGNYLFEQKVYDFLGIESDKSYYDPKGDVSVNSGLVPRIIQPRPEDWELEISGNTYHIPANRAYFCSTKKRSHSYGPDDREYDTISRLGHRQAHWLTPPDAELRDRIQEEHARPIREHLESTFGVDLSSWDNVHLNDYEVVLPSHIN
ncbi:sulfotransferase family protein [Roseovarius salinarum]|uniref:sulfotransferase family protein n=1 Tax=Roseovarius salinarum TaxID=1981892 RepID=UPI000C345B9E|nr:sulfotransferase [Roseovarius salinarum]